MNETALVNYDAACQAIALCFTTDEANEIKNKAIALAAYAKQMNNKEAQIQWVGVSTRAERRWGQIYAESAKATPGPKPEIGSDSEPNTPPTLAEMGVSKKASAKAQQLAAIPDDEFEAVMDDWQESVSQEGARVADLLSRKAAKATREQNNKQTTTRVAPPVGTYSLIYCDPPWRYEHVKTENRAIENHYPTMDLDEIKELSVPAADDCVLFMWATSPKLAESIEVIEAWGFNYRTCAVWVKDKIGMGYYFRQRHELLLIATKGTPGVPEPSDRIDSVIESPRGKHSAKPLHVYDILESMYPDAAKIELFSRVQREGWAAWGNQADAE